ncbi:MAG TPA: hypothetical protein VK814_07260 [Acidobacteriaceae bacterium]|nr:hypothetical protein [Acidobacteriaceae bacterium]
MKRIYLLLAFCCFALVGCGSDGMTFPVTGAPISGKLLSGTLPVAKAHIYLMAVAATGYGKPSVSLLDARSTGSQDAVGAYVVTAADGSFTIPGYYRCGAETGLYIYARGGDSGMGQNSAATELAAIGPCPQAQADVPPVVVDEVTTVAMSFALAGFANDALHIASSGSPLALVGVANAFVNASNLAPITTGVAPATLPSGSATVPQATINTLANILFSCIHSGGDHSSACQALLDPGSTRPSSDTASAMIAIAHSPANAVSTLFAQQSSAPPFTPYLTTAPNDFSLGLVFTGGGINLTVGMAVDAMGNVWSISNGDTSTNYNLYVTEISSAGAFVSGPNGYLSGQQVYEIGLSSDQGPIAVDTLGNVWIGIGGNSGGGSLWELSSTGTVLFKSGGVVTSLSSGYDGFYPTGLAIDANNNIWVADRFANMVDEFSSSGQLLSGSNGFTSGGISDPTGLAITPSGNVWIINDTDSPFSISELSSSGAPLTPSTGLAGAGFFGGATVAVDHQNNVWTARAGLDAQVSKVSPDGAILSGSGYATTAMQGADGDGVSIAIDGDDNVWTPAGPSNVIELSNTGEILSGATGYTAGLSTGLATIVIDGSGDLWGSSATYTPPTKRGVAGVFTWEIVEIIGVAAPVVTPIAAGVKLNMLGARP